MVILYLFISLIGMLLLLLSLITLIYPFKILRIPTRKLALGLLMVAIDLSTYAAGLMEDSRTENAATTTDKVEEITVSEEY